MTIKITRWELSDRFAEDALTPEEEPGTLHTYVTGHTGACSVKGDLVWTSDGRSFRVGIKDAHGTRDIAAFPLMDAHYMLVGIEEKLGDKTGCDQPLHVGGFVMMWAWEDRSLYIWYGNQEHILVHEDDLVRLTHFLQNAMWDAKVPNIVNRRRR